MSVYPLLTLLHNYICYFFRVYFTDNLWNFLSLRHFHCSTKNIHLAVYRPYTLHSTIHKLFYYYYYYYCYHQLLIMCVYFLSLFFLLRLSFADSTILELEKKLLDATAKYANNHNNNNNCQFNASDSCLVGSRTVMCKYHWRWRDCQNIKYYLKKLYMIYQTIL